MSLAILLFRYIFFIDNVVLGPALPPHLIKRNEEPPKEDLINIGPALPPSMQKNEEPDEKDAVHIGPLLPAHLREQLANRAPASYDSEEEKEQDPDVFGPLPPGMGGTSQAHVALEERAMQMRIDKLTPANENETVREEWMLELPEVKASRIGLGPRQFRKNAAPDLSDR